MASVIRVFFRAAPPPPSASPPVAAASKCWSAMAGDGHPDQTWPRGRCARAMACPSPLCSRKKMQMTEAPCGSSLSCSVRRRPFFVFFHNLRGLQEYKPHEFRGFTLYHSTQTSFLIYATFYNTVTMENLWVF